VNLFVLLVLVHTFLCLW